MSSTRSMQELLLSGPKLFERPKVRKKWFDAINSGDVATASALMKAHDLSANFSAAKDYQENPLTTLLLADRIPLLYAPQAKLAQFLIDKKCDLKSPDDCNMVPADYAVLSGNARAAAIVIRDTIVQDGIQNRTGHIPNVDGYFSSVVEEGHRRRRFSLFKRNHEFIGKVFRNAVDNGHDGALAIHMSEEQRQYWRCPLGAQYGKMPHPQYARG